VISSIAYGSELCKATAYGVTRCGNWEQWQQAEYVNNNTKTENM